MKRTAPRLSIVVPLYNEEESMPLFFERIRDVAPSLGSFELVMVDDGSSDHTTEAILLEKGNVPVCLVRFGRNFGQTAALAAGIERASGEIIVTIDADLENDPRDIPLLIKKLDEGFGVVSGWRQGRWKNEFFARRLPSVMANKLISFFTGVRLHDYGCTLKAYKADIVQDIRLYGDMHRFVAAFAAWRGGRIAEVPVSFEPRRFGKSNYGFGRILRVLLDLVFVAFMRRYFSHPMQFFGGWGCVSIIAGFATLCIGFILKFSGGPTLIETPLPTLAALFVIVGVQFVLFGVLAEILVRTYYESQDKRPFSIAQIYTHEG